MMNLHDEFSKTIPRRMFVEWEFLSCSNWKESCASRRILTKAPVSNVPRQKYNNTTLVWVVFKWMRGRWISSKGNYLANRNVCMMCSQNSSYSVCYQRANQTANIVLASIAVSGNLFLQDSNETFSGWSEHCFCCHETWSKRNIFY